MSDLKRRTPEEVELWYLGKIASMTVEMMDFKDHAVEVLAKELDRIEQGRKYISWEEEVCELTKDRIRAEARALLGIKEGE